MKPRAIYRWKSFWLGILVLGFLGWAWRESCHNETNYGTVRVWEGWAMLPVGISHADSRLTIRVARQLGPGKAVVSSKNNNFGFSRSLTNPTGEPPALRWRILPSRTSAHAGIALHVIELPHWFLILLFLVPWSAWLFSHWKREQKKLTA